MALRFPTLSVNFGSSGGLLFELHWVLTRTPDFVWNWRYDAAESLSEARTPLWR